MSTGSSVSPSSIVRATSTGSEAARRRVGENGSTSPAPSTTGPSSARSSSDSGRSRRARRVSRTSDDDCEGARMRTLWPRPNSSPDTRSTYSFTSPATSQANGVTCTIVSGSATGTGFYGAALLGGPGSAGLGGSALGRCGRSLARVLLDDRLGQVTGLGVRALVHRRLHQVRARAVELARQPVVERELATAHGVDH